MAKPRPTLETTISEAQRRLRRPLRLTFFGLWVERLLIAFWPLLTVAMVGSSVLMLDLLRSDPDPARAQIILYGLIAAAFVTAGVGIWRLKTPRLAEALDRIDRSLPDRPVTAIGDAQIIGARDGGSKAVWRSHVEKMAERVSRAGAVAPNLRLAGRDRLGLRLMAATVFGVALIFGSIWRIGGIGDIAAPDPANALAAGPSWEGWVEPPVYTGQPSLYLNDLTAAQLTLIEGTRITIRLYGELGSLAVTETVSGAPPTPEDAVDPSALTVSTFDVARAGNITIEGEGGQAWEILLRSDTAPNVVFDGDLEWAVDGGMRQAFTATDDFGVVRGLAEIALDYEALDRRYGLSKEPEPREPIILDLPLPITGDRSEFSEILAENLSQHPWARMPVALTLLVEDANGQTAATEPQLAQLPGRGFFDPLAKSVIEVRRDLLWTRENGPRSAQILRAVTHLPDGFMRSETVYLKLRTAIRRLEQDVAGDQFDAKARDDLADVLWDIALEIEFGNLNDARQRLERAQERLSEAIENGASDEEIAALIEELRQAMQEYMRQLAQNQAQDGQNQQAQNQGDMQELSGQQLSDMLDRLQELMEQGRTAEAQQLLDQLRQMMQNMQITQGQQGQGQQSPGQQAMEGLGETLREQQGLSDEAFRDLQEQFNGGSQSGQAQNNTGRDGGQGRGQSHDPSQGQQGGSEDQQGGAEGGPGGDLEQSLADRQRALRQELNRQQQNLPGAGTEDGDAAREALGRAGEAMDRAEDDLRADDLAGALDNQADAMEALREGMRALGEMLAEQQQQQNGQGQQAGADALGRRDPLGREQGNTGRLGTDENMLQGDDVYRRARELFDEIRRRSGDRTRPEPELDYLRRLLDRF